jgi:hypothetical protein
MALFTDEVGVKSPCGERWEAMTAASGGRHCEVCDHTVYDLSQHTEREARELLARGKVCVRYRATRDGKVMTAPSRVIPPSRLLAKAKPIPFLASALTVSCTSQDDAVRIGETQASSSTMSGAPTAPLAPEPTGCENYVHMANGGSGYCERVSSPTVMGDERRAAPSVPPPAPSSDSSTRVAPIW